MKFIRHIPAFIDIDVQKVFTIDKIEDIFEFDFMKHYADNKFFTRFIIDKENVRDEIALIRCQYGENIYLSGRVVEDDYLK